MTARVLVLTAAYPGPTEPERAVFLENLHRALVAETGGSIELTVVAPRVHRADPPVEERWGIPVRRFPYPSGGRRLKEHARIPWWSLFVYVLSASWSLLWLGRHGAYRVLVCHWVLPAGIAARIAAAVLDLPLVLFAHGSDLQRYAARSRLALALARGVARRAVEVFAVSEALAAFARERLRVPRERVVVLRMGVAEVFTPGDRGAARARLGLGDGVHALFVGDISEEKGVRDLIEAIRSFGEPGAELHVHLAGRGQLEPEVAGVPRLRLLGVLSQDTLADWYRAADLLLLPSHSEGSPLAVMEALACGLPVVATRVGGIPELVEHGVTGLLVPPHDPAALAGALEELLADPERLARLRREAAARRTVPAARESAARLGSSLLSLAEEGRT